MTDRETPKSWAAVPGTNEQAPIIEIVALVIGLGGLLLGTTGILGALAVMLFGGA